ncbi:MAG: hypothetical protein COS92_00040 [Desulfobacterales bacterium CG07_land_8_20_14_0_80_52_14]|nr:MAG: hypothetical protein COX20_13135 [Desulfobacterales bacterium CG23_combo_of_CG06-09_8_20_14_all_52_9]PIU50670.1 MAG: hypothetical protein COS92_00040 [Desulfobacterales bacterium CG07_land_8_20_14_0_80_52_14]
MKTRCPALNFVHCTKIFKCRLSIIRKRDAVGESAAQKAERIVEGFTLGFERNDRQGQSHMTTKRGELRITKCRKYKLGGGYRLITLRRKNILHIVYIGTHDECTRWLEHHRGISEVDVKVGDTLTPFSVSRNRSGDGLLPPIDPQEASDVSPVAIGDRELRIIFQGLVDARNSSKSERCQSRR